MINHKSIFYVFFSATAFVSCTLNSEIVSKLSEPVDLSPIVEEPDDSWLTNCSATVTNNFGGGDGTNNYPYLICSLAHWDHLAVTPSSWDKSIKLASDLDFSGLDFSNLKRLNDGSQKFSGQFDGGNFSMKNISISAGASNFSLFGNTSGNPIFKNLILENFNLSASMGFAALITLHDSSGTLTIDNVQLKNSVYSHNGSGLVLRSDGPVDIQNVRIENLAISASGTSATGGIIGQLFASGTFDRINVDGFTQTYSCCAFPYGIGGIVGNVNGTASPGAVSVTNSEIINISLAGTSTARMVGGVFGIVRDSSITISDVTVAGTIHAKDAGGLVGYHEQILSANRTFTATRNLVTLNFSNCGNGLCGGLVGWLQYPSSISQSKASGSLTNWTGLSGGLVGQIDADTTITDSYASMNMTKTGNSGTVGGVVGGLSSGTTNLIRTHFTGIQNFTGGGAPLKGCIVAGNFATLIVTDSYYDSSICLSSSVNSAGYAGASGIATGAFQTATPFAGWSPNTWTFSAGQNPKLAIEP